MKTTWYWHKNKQVDKWNRIEDPDINPHTYEHLIFDKEAKVMQWNKESIFNKWCWHNWMPTCKNSKRSISISMHKTQIQIDQRSQHKSSHIELH